jgi:molybdopterin converting factor small subunit
LKIRIKAFGPEITSLIERDKVVVFESDGTVDDLFRRLEEDIRAEHGRTVKMLESDFMILINGRNIETLSDRTLRDGDSLTILSAIGGG